MKKKARFLNCLSNDYFMVVASKKQQGMREELILDSVDWLISLKRSPQYNNAIHVSHQTHNKIF